MDGLQRWRNVCQKAAQKTEGGVMSNILLLDGDIILYQQACLNEQTIDWGDGGESTLLTPEVAQANLDDIIAHWTEKFKARYVYVCLGSSNNFRKKLMPEYKHFRKKLKKPVLRYDLINYVSMNYNVISWDTLEADDVMGIMSTGPLLKELGTPVIISIDKDLKQIPGKLYNPNKDTKIRTVTQEEADYTFYLQVLMGDPADGYKGIPGVGIKTAEKILHEVEDYWPAVVEAYEAKGLTEEDALLNARMARILRWEDYDYDNKEVILWTPCLRSEEED
jgi:DNA polymerase-1